jgi:diguanylate cyclase (GGDEF)-like protein
MRKRTKSPSGVSGEPGTETAVLVDSKRRIKVWLAVAMTMLIVGTLSTVLVAHSVADNYGTQSRRTFQSTSAGIASTLQLSIQHEEDLIISASGFVVGNSTASNVQFVSWANSVQALHRYPELQGIGESVIVPEAQLSAFEAKITLDPPSPLIPGEAFQVIPAGIRPFYCFSVANASRTSKAQFPLGFDFCAGSFGEVQLAVRDSGKSAYLPIRNKNSTLLSVVTPVYRGGVVPATLAARRSEFLGWIGMSLLPQIVLDRALQGHPGIAVSFHYDANFSNATFQSGHAPIGATSSMTNLHNGWTVTTIGLVAGGGIFTDGNALALLIAGIALSLLLSILILILATGRMRALRLVGNKTDELRHQALHDSLTGLPNRALIADRIEHLLARNHRNGTVPAALYVDLDEFKNVNDTLGHEAGDRLLQAVAERLTMSLRGADTIGRMGGDEFVVLLDGAAEHGAPELVAERILEVMRQPFEIRGAAMPMVVTTSIGIAIGHRDSPVELLRDADVALYQAKAAGKNCYETFRQEMETTIQHRYELEFDLRAALECSQFHLVYQPIYNLDDLTLNGVEALIRWDHPSLGEIQPDEFIPILESSGQIIEVGRWVLGEACRQMVVWRESGSDLNISVNVSGRQLDRDVIVEHVREALAESGLDPEHLTIEVTETALMRNVDTTARRLGELKALGVQVAIDDFGTGYSSLAYLQRFPVDCLKIDRTFTDAIARSPESDALIHTLVQLGRDLGLKTLAEGVETTEQMDHLRGQRVDEVQGFLLARPLDSKAFEDRLLRPTFGVGSALTTPKSPS